MSEAPFDPESFLQVARDLASSGGGEAHRRSAISRAYYACYHLALLALRRRWSWREPEQGRHRAVTRAIADFQRTQPVRRYPTSLAAKLEALLAMRELADYATGTRVTVADEQEALDLAEDLVRRLRSLANVTR